MNSCPVTADLNRHIANHGNHWQADLDIEQRADELLESTDFLLELFAELSADEQVLALRIALSNHSIKEAYFKLAKAEAKREQLSGDRVYTD